VQRCGGAWCTGGLPLGCLGIRGLLQLHADPMRGTTLTAKLWVRAWRSKPQHAAGPELAYLRVSMELQQAPVPKQPTGTPPVHHAPRQRRRSCMSHQAHMCQSPERAPGGARCGEVLTACTSASIATGSVMCLKLHTLSAVPSLK